MTEPSKAIGASAGKDQCPGSMPGFQTKQSQTGWKPDQAGRLSQHQDADQASRGPGVGQGMGTWPGVPSSTPEDTVTHPGHDLGGWKWADRTRAEKQCELSVGEVPELSLDFSNSRSD